MIAIGVRIQNAYTMASFPLNLHLPSSLATFDIRLFTSSQIKSISLDENRKYIAYQIWNHFRLTSVTLFLFISPALCCFMFSLSCFLPYFLLCLCAFQLNCYTIKFEFMELNAITTVNSINTSKHYQ